MSTCAAVLTRCCLDEGPYLNGFVSHYLSLNFSKIYVVNTSISPGYVLDSIDPTYHQSIEVLNFRSNILDWQEKLFRWVGDFLYEDWILNVDIDEFLCIDEDCIISYLSKVDASIEKIHFRWLLCVSDRYQHESIEEMNDLPLHLSSQFKSMIKTDAIVELGVHDSSIINPDRFLREPLHNRSGFVMHYACRGFLDLINRIVGRNYENIKSGHNQETSLKKMFYKPHKFPLHFPFRFNQLRVIRSLPTYSISTSRLPKGSALAPNNDLLQSITINKLTLLDLGRFIENKNLEYSIETRLGLTEILLDNVIPATYGMQYIRGELSLTNTTRLYIEHLKNADSLT